MRRCRLLLGVVLLIAAANGIFYAVTIPPWDLYDEGTHLAYALTVRDERRIPHLEEHTRQDVVASEIETERWERFQIGRPDTSSLDAMGLGGRLYQGYQPPLYYLLILPATVITPDDVKTTMYLARLMTGPVMLVALTAITWALARAWFPKSGDLIAFVAAFVVAVAPAAGEAAGRVNNDLLAATLIAASLLVATRVIRKPSPAPALALGLIAALAILTKAHGMMLLPLIGAALTLLWWRKGLGLETVALSAGPPLMAAIGWTVWTYLRYGVWTGSAAFLAFARPFEPLGLLEFAEAAWFNAWSSYWVTHDGDWVRTLTGWVILVLVIIGLVGLWRVHVRPEIWILTSVLAAGMLIMLWYGNTTGFVYPQGRILLPLLPPASVLVAVGWSGAGRRAVSLVPAGIAGLLTVMFITGWYLPFFYG